MSWFDVTVLSSLQVAKVRPDGWNATELTSEEWPHNIWVQPGILNNVVLFSVSIRTVPLSIYFYWTMFKCQIIEPQVPEPGGLVYTARDKDSFLARMDDIHKKNLTKQTSIPSLDECHTLWKNLTKQTNKQTWLGWIHTLWINLTKQTSKSGSDGCLCGQF